MQDIIKQQADKRTLGKIKKNYEEKNTFETDPTGTYKTAPEGFVTSRLRNATMAVITIH